jgi:hypothetical protein
MRLENWDFSLLEQVERGSALPFQYGGNDCLWFVLNCVVAMTGKAPPCPAYKTAKQARLAFKRLGLVRLGDYLAQHFEELASPLQAMRGDVGVVAQGDAECCVINIGGAWVGKGETGAVRVPLGLVTRCFRVA